MEIWMYLWHQEFDQHPVFMIESCNLQAQPQLYFPTRTSFWRRLFYCLTYKACFTREHYTNVIDKKNPQIPALWNPSVFPLTILSLSFFSPLFFNHHGARSSITEIETWKEIEMIWNTWLHCFVTCATLWRFNQQELHAKHSRWMELSASPPFLQHTSY